MAFHLRQGIWVCLEWNDFNNELKVTIWAANSNASDVFELSDEQFTPQRLVLMNDSLHEVRVPANVSSLALQKIIRLISHVALQTLKLYGFIKLWSPQC